MLWCDVEDITITVGLMLGKFGYRNDELFAVECNSCDRRGLSLFLLSIGNLALLLSIRTVIVLSIRFLH